MKKLSNPIIVSCISTGLGIFCLLARLWMMKTGIDTKDLLVTGHPGGILSWILTAVFVILLAASAILRPEKYSFQANLLSGCSGVACGLALLCTVLLVCTGQTAMFTDKLTGKIVPLSVALAALAGISTLSCGVLAWFRFRGKRAWLPLYLPGIITLMLQFLCCFRYWGAESELQRYLFSLCAQIFILLTLFYRAAAECKMRAPMLYFLFSNAAVFFGLSAVADGGVGYVFGLWAVAVALENISLRVSGSKHHAAS